MKTKSNIQTIRENFVSNRLSIETATGLNTLEYNNLQFEAGIRFLEERFPVNTEFEQYYMLYSRSAAFWKWWRAEWAIWECDYMNFVRQHNFNLTLKSYQSDLEHPRTQSRIESSFHHQFLKHLQHEFI